MPNTIPVPDDHDPQPQPGSHHYPALEPQQYQQRLPPHVVQPTTAPQGGGVAGMVADGVKTFAGLPRDQIILLLVVLVTTAILGTGIYIAVILAPKMLVEDRNNWIRTNQEERERDRMDRERDRMLSDQNNARWMDLVKKEGESNRRSSEAQTTTLYQGTLVISKELGKVQASNDRLEQSIQKLETTIRNKMPGGGGDERPPECELRPWWERLRDDGALPDADLPVNRGGSGLAVVDDGIDRARDDDGLLVVRRG
jgi:hypothetical protein